KTSSSHCRITAIPLITSALILSGTRESKSFLCNRFTIFIRNLFMIPEKLRARLHTIIHEADTPAGKMFDLTLLALILISIAAVMLESVSGIKEIYGFELALI